jgi:hypothetical protein
MIQGQQNLQKGSRIAEVGNWQRFLNGQGTTDASGYALAVDEDFGEKTLHATRTWQTKVQLPATGELDTVTRLAAERQGFVPFLQAKNCNVLHPKQRFIGRIVIHTMENDERNLNQAESVALWFADRLAPKYSAPVASAHYCVDSNSVVQCVRDFDVAWHAPGVNHDGIGIELAGTAAQTAAQWRDPTSQAILRNAARVCAALCLRYVIPVHKLSIDEVRVPKRSGFLGHVDATYAFPGPMRTHTDPGLEFPWSDFLEMVKACLG